MKGPGLHPTPEAPYEFKGWVEQVLADWDFDNMCCAHIENKIGGAHEGLKKTLEEAESTFQKLSKNAKGDLPKCKKSKDKDESSKYNVSGNECG
jgi:hypothetical protein